MRTWESKACGTGACERQGVGRLLVRRVQGDGEVSQGHQLHVPGLAQTSQQSTILPRPGDVAYFSSFCGVVGTSRCPRRMRFGSLSLGNALSEAPAQSFAAAADSIGTRAAACAAHQSILCEVVGRAKELRRSTNDCEGSSSEMCVLDNAAGSSARTRGRTCNGGLFRMHQRQILAGFDVERRQRERRVAARGARGCAPSLVCGSVRRASGGLGAASDPCGAPDGVHARQRSGRVGREAAHGVGARPFDPVEMFGRLRAHVQHTGVPSVQASHDACVGFVARFASVCVVEQPWMDDAA
mmetsp:Transcript_9136/g.32376  ORF Transcript_9136/g.32376 Transcript_9136/m.32376 type:complete len:298 (+) Transcript_9136:116-1009(+)